MYRRTDRIYVTRGKNPTVYTSPDGIGRYFYEDVAEAKAESSLSVVHSVPEQDD